MRIKLICSVAGGLRGSVLFLLAVFYLAALSGCHRHYRSAPVEKHSSTTPTHQLNPDGTYQIKQGDTLYGIAFNYGVDTMDLAKWNGISSPFTIYPGQKIRLSAPAVSNTDSGRSSGVQISAIKTPSPAKTKPLIKPAESSAASKQPTPPNTTAKEKAVNTGAAPAIPASDPKSWKWPVKGRLLRTYVAGDPARNGLDISGKEGQPVIASASGQVVYSGSGLIGYGELIIIKHSEKMLSAYAHNKTRLVKEGEQVSAGQKIAEMGRNSANEPLLHFEIRSYGKPVNPLIYLPKN